MLQEGMQAPAVMLADKDGKMVSLSDFLGKKVVLYFYPKDNTPGCTRQACAFAAAYGEFEKKNAVVIGISKDSVSSHEKFAEKYNLPFILLSGKTSMGVVRTTFIIDEQGKILKVMPKVKPDTNAEDVLKIL